MCPDIKLLLFGFNTTSCTGQRASEISSSSATAGGMQVVLVRLKTKLLPVAVVSHTKLISDILYIKRWSMT